MSKTLQLVPFKGINADCLGHYLMGLGLLRAASTRWVEARGCWHGGQFYLAGSFTRNEVAEFLAADWRPTPYLKWWSADQKTDTKTRTSSRIWLARSAHSILQVRVADSTIVPGNRNQFNPLFGTGGNVGKRNLETAWREAVDLCKADGHISWLEASLFGKQATEVPPFTNGGTWFVYDNKTFNSGLDWYREGSLSPWSFLLAMEGALLARGGSGKRLGSHGRPYAVFPFISQPLNPAANEEIGQKAAGEFWAPLWEQPATLGEVRALFQRGLARLGGRPASAPHEFAVAALAAGTDAGVTHFVRFELRQTTSSQVYEAMPRQTFAVQSKLQPQTAIDDASPSILLEAFLGHRWFDRLPYEPQRRDSKVRFFGLRGPLERLILAVASDPENPEFWSELWLRLSGTQSRIDRNLNLRKKCQVIPWLPWQWLGKAFPGTPPLHIRLAAALASMGASTDYPAQCNVFGVEIKKERITFQQTGRSARAIWHDGESQVVLLDFLQRRLTDCSEEYLATLNSHLRVAPNDIEQFLMADLGLLDKVQRWLPPLTLLDWAKAPCALVRVGNLNSPSAELLLWAFFKPFFFTENFNIRSRGRMFFRDKAKAKPSFARQLFYRLRQGAWAEAIELAFSGYSAQGISVVTPVVTATLDSERFAAALALPISADDLSGLVIRWIEPAKQSKKENND